MKRKLNKSFGKILKNYRNNNSVNQCALANKLKVTQSQICHWEHGHNLPSRLRQESISKILEFSMPIYCQVIKCKNLGIRLYFINKSVIPKEYYEIDELHFYLCAEHAEQQYSLGLDVFCDKYKLRDKLNRARAFYKTLLDRDMRKN